MDKMKSSQQKTPLSIQKSAFEHLLVISEKYVFIEQNLKGILDEIVSSVCELIDADCAVLYPYDADREEYYDKVNVATFGLRKPLELSEKPRSDRSMANYIKKSGEIVITDIEHEDQDMFKSDFIQREEVGAFMAAAPKVGEEALGLFFVNFRSPHNFTEEDKSIIRLFANQAGIAISNARLDTRTKQQADALRKMYDVGLSIVAIPTKRKPLKDLLDQIAGAAKSVLGADLVDLYHYIREEERFELPPSFAGDRKNPPIKAVYPDDIVYQIVHKGLPLFVKDVKKEPLLTKPFDDDRPEEAKTMERFVYRENIASVTAIPLTAANQVVGVLFVNYRKPQTFPEHQRELISVFATQAAIAIANATLFETSQKREATLQSLSAVTENLVQLSEGTADLNDLLQQIANSAKDALNADLVDLYQYRQGLDDYPLPVIRAGERYKWVEKDKIREDDIVCAVVQHGIPWYIENAQAEVDLHRTYYERENQPAERFVDREKIQSMVSIPMKTGNEIVGVLFVNYRQKQSFTKSQRALIELFANQAGVAIRNTRPLMRRKALLRFSETISKYNGLTEQGVIELVTKQAAELMDNKNMYIALYDHTTDRVSFGLAIRDGVRIDLQNDIGWQPRNAGQGRTEEIIRTGKPILHPTKKEANEWYSQPGREATVKEISSSWLGVPMIVGSRVIGVIATYHQTRENVYTQEDLISLQTIADLAAIALENARMFNRINKKLENINAFGNELTAGARRNEQEVLELIRGRAGNLMNTESMYIALYDEGTDTVTFGLAYETDKRIDGWNPRKSGRGLTEEVIKSKRPLLFSSRTQANAWYEELGHSEYIGKVFPSWLGVPMILGERTFGMIAVYHPEKEFIYDQDDLQILQAIANQAVIAIANSRNEENLRGLVEFGQVITSKIHFTENQILEQIRSSAANFLDANNIYIALRKITEKEQEVVKFVLVYRNGNPHKWDDRPIEFGRTGEIIRTKKPLFLLTREDIKKWFDEHPSEPERLISASWLGVPMMIGDKVLGVIGVDHPDQEQHYTGNDLDILQALANLAAIAFENSQLYNKARDDIIAERQLSILGRALASIEHRINNTLNIIVPNLNRLRKRVNEDDPEIKEIIDIIDRNTRYTTQLLDKIQKPLQEVSHVEVDINAVLNEVVNEQRKEWKSDSTHLLVNTTLDLDERIPVLSLPVGQISEDFQNLIQNAYRALQKSYHAKSQSGAKLHVESRLEGDKIYIRVKDNVPGGIPISVRNRLFDKPVPPKAPGEGSGLGLWLSKLSLRSINGDIRIEKTGLLGTTMLVEIPIPVDKETENENPNLNN